MHIPCFLLTLVQKPDVNGKLCFMDFVIGLQPSHSHMKHSQTIGFISALAIIGICFLPWSFIVSQNITVSGFHAEGTNFGKPGLFNLALCVVMMVLFAVPAVWSKRTNVLIAALNLAWSFRNYLLLSSCMMGECPQKKPALYLLLLLAFVLQAMTLLPKLEVKK